MPDHVTLEFPREGVACVTLRHPEVSNHGTWALVDALADALEAAREQGARVVVLASGVEGHWSEHAWLADLRNMVLGRPTTSGGAGWFAALFPIARNLFFALAAIEIIENEELRNAAKQEHAEKLGENFEYIPLLGDRPPPLDYRR